MYDRRKKIIIAGIVIFLICIILVRINRKSKYVYQPAINVNAAEKNEKELKENLVSTLEFLKNQSGKIEVEEVNKYLKNSYIEIAKTSDEVLYYEIYDCNNKKVSNYPDYIITNDSNEKTMVDYAQICQNGDNSDNYIETDNQYIVKIFPEFDSNVYYFLIKVDKYGDAECNKYCITNGEVKQEEPDSEIEEEYEE